MLFKCSHRQNDRPSLAHHCRFVRADAAAGGTDDYVKELGVKYSYVAELRGYDFVIDKRQIQDSFEEIWSGVVAMCDAIAAKED